MFTVRRKIGRFGYLVRAAILLLALVAVVAVAAYCIFSGPDTWFVNSLFAIPGSGGTAEGGRWGCLYLLFLICAVVTASIDVMLSARRVRDIGWPVFPVTLGIFALRFSLPLFLMCAFLFNLDAGWVSDISGLRWWGLLVLGTFLILLFEPGASSRHEKAEATDKAGG